MNMNENYSLHNGSVVDTPLFTPTDLVMECKAHVTFLNWGRLHFQKKKM